MRVIAVFLLVMLKARSQGIVTTYRNNLARTGENLQETILTPSNVTPGQFGKLFAQPVDGQVYAQPLYVPGLLIPDKGMHNVVFVATSHDTVYAFDADSNSGANAAPLWQAHLTTTPGERPLNVSDVLGCTVMVPEIGITGTPVIDTAAGILYVIAATVRDQSFVHRLHALDIATGSERPGSPVVIDAFVPGTGDGFSRAGVPFHPYLQKNRAGLLLMNGVVYTAWTSHCDTGPYHGWIIGYDGKDLRQVAVFNSSPNGWQGSFWMGGAAPAADSSGNMYVVSGNGIFNADENGTEFGDSILKLSTSRGLAIADYFTPFNQLFLNRTDMDLGSGGVVLLPDTAGSSDHRHLLISAGKEGRIYLLDRDRMGNFHIDGDRQIVQSVAGAVGPVYGSPAYFNNTVYFSASNDTLKAFSFAGGKLGTTPVSRSSRVFSYPGAIPTISANGTSNGIVWLVEGGAGGTLHAYDATNVARELYNSQMNADRDALGSSVRFIVPTVANGKVYVGTGNSVAVFGLLDPPQEASVVEVVNAPSLQAGRCGQLSKCPSADQITNPYAGIQIGLDPASSGVVAPENLWRMELEYDFLVEKPGMRPDKIRKRVDSRRQPDGNHETHPQDGDGLMVLLLHAEMERKSLNALTHSRFGRTAFITSDVDPRQPDMIGVPELIARKAAAFKFRNKDIVFQR
jgi:hypothetical protein